MQPGMHDLDDFMVAATRAMASEYDRIQKRVKEDPGTAGDQGEENWATLLRGWLPPTFQIETKGRILSYDGSASPQVDVLVLHPTYPKNLLDKKLYLAGGVAAAFECKATLRAAHVRKAVENAAKIRRHLEKRTGSPYKELHSAIIYGLLAHSHAWQRPRSRPIKNVDKHLVAADYEFVKHPREMLDLVCVADVATWVSSRTSWVGPGMVPDWSAIADGWGPKGSAATAYSCFSEQVQVQKAVFTPIGAMISSLVSKLAWEDPSIRGLARYFRLANLSGTGLGKLRLWEDDIYSDEVRAGVISGRRVSPKPWDEWSIVFW